MKNIISLLSACSGGFNWYGFIIGAGMVICIIGAYFLAKKRGYYKDLVFDIAILCIPLAIIGARVYYVIFSAVGEGVHWTFKSFFGFNDATGEFEGFSGLAIYGGVIGGVIGGIILHFIKYRKEDEKQRVNFWQIADLGFLFIILGQAIGRWGNFANQEAYGNPVTNPKLQWFPYAVYIDAEHGYFQATFFYESLWNIIGFGLLLWAYIGKRKSFDGFIFSSYCIYYGIGRLWIEALRSDSLKTAMGLRVSQIVSIILIIFGICYIVAHLYRARNKGLKPFIFVDESKLDETYFGYRECILHHPNDYTKPLKEETPDYDDEFYSQADDGFDGGQDGGSGEETVSDGSAEEESISAVGTDSDEKNTEEKMSDDDDFYSESK